MIRAVLDTNVLISSIFWRGPPYKVVKAGLEGKYRPVISTPILEELADKLRGKFEVPEDKIGLLVDILLVNSEVVEPSSEIDIVEDDPSDNKIIECAVDGNAGFVVTGDSDLLDLEDYEGMKIVEPSRFLEIIS